MTDRLYFYDFCMLGVSEREVVQIAVRGDLQPYLGIRNSGTNSAEVPELVARVDRNDLHPLLKKAGILSAEDRFFISEFLNEGEIDSISKLNAVILGARLGDLFFSRIQVQDILELGSYSDATAPAPLLEPDPSSDLTDGLNDNQEATLNADLQGWRVEGQLLIIDGNSHLVKSNEAFILSKIEAQVRRGKRTYSQEDLINICRHAKPKPIRYQSRPSKAVKVAWNEGIIYESIGKDGIIKGEYEVRAVAQINKAVSMKAIIKKTVPGQSNTVPEASSEPRLRSS